MTVSLLSPSTGIFKPPMVSRHHDTDRRWRQLTKLPWPFPQYPPFTLRYGKSAWFSPSGGSWRSRHYQYLIQSFRFTARTLDTILLRYLNTAGSHRVRDRFAFRMGTAHRERSLNTDYEQNNSVICQSTSGVQNLPYIISRWEMRPGPLN